MDRPCSFPRAPRSTLSAPAPAAGPLTARGNGMAPGVPCTFVFAPDWWHRHYGIAFDKKFYFDRDTRIRNDVLMRRALHERFGIGTPDPQPRPVIGSLHVAGGFVVPALLGVEI